MSGFRRAFLLGGVATVGALVAVFAVNRLTQPAPDPTPPANGSLVSDGLALSHAANRAVAIRTTSCGDASQGFGSGLMVSPGRILTAAHVVAGAGSVSVEAGSWSTSGKVIGYDTKRDLAVIEVAESLPLPIRTSVTFTQLDVGDSGRIVGAAASGSIPFTIEERTTIETDDVREPTRSRRAGYIVDVSTERGDSGAGAYSLDGSLVGVVFATSAVAEGRSFATSSSEVEAFLSQVEADRVFECDPATSKLVG